MAPCSVTLNDLELLGKVYSDTKHPSRGFYGTAELLVRKAVRN